FASSSLYAPGPHRALHSFPTRRSSDLGGMETILCVTPLGRKRTVRAKLAVSAGVAAAIAVSSCLPHLIQVLRDYGLPALLAPARSEEHTSELQSRFDLVCRLLLEKKKR